MSAPLQSDAPLRLVLLPERFALCQAPPGTPLAGALATSLRSGRVGSTAKGGFVSMTWADDELSIVLPEQALPLLHAATDGAPSDASHTNDAQQSALRVETGFACLRVEGPLDLALVGILARLSGALAAAGVPLFALSTFNTDYLMVRADRLDDALAALRAAGCTVRE